MKLISLTQGKHAMVDDEDYEMLMDWKWLAVKGVSTFYAAAKPCRVKQKHGWPKTLLMHRLIMKTHPNLQVDHLDGDGLNNQKENMRNATARENQQNLHGQLTSQYPGVHWRPIRGKWRAQINIGGKMKILGEFTGEKDAALAYRNACFLLCRKEKIKDIVERQKKTRTMSAMKMQT